MPDLSRRTFLESYAAALLAGGQLPAAEVPKRPNLVLYQPETLRAESLACYGHPLVKTPNIDRLAREGTRFEQCHVQNPVCGASRCSLMTGWPVHVRGHRNLAHFLHNDEPNLFRYLRENNYDVYWYGKNDLLAPDSFPSSVTDWGPKRARKPAPTNPWKLGDPHYYSFLYGPTEDRRDSADYANIQAAIQILEQRDRPNPFCIFLPLGYVHPPFSAPADFHGMYDPRQLPPLRPPNLPNKPNFYEAIRRTRHLDRLTDVDFRKIQAVYLGMITYCDWLLGEFLEAIERTNHKNDTAFFFFSDHGEWGGDYGLVEKWPSAMDGVLEHIPLIARVPGMPDGLVSKEIVELYDVMATCLDLAGATARHTHFAQSLIPQLSGKPGDPSRAAFCEGGFDINEPQSFESMDAEGHASPDYIYYPKAKLENDHPETVTRATAITTPDYKLVARVGGNNELYDRKKDPRELHNVFGQRTYANAQETLQRRMLDWYIHTADVVPKQQDPRGFPPRPKR
jgi:arylsulfatase A-like enzyme